MHLQQIKLESRATGGPQYWIQSAPGYSTEYLRRRRACPVVLQTPYGITWSQFVAVHRPRASNPGRERRHGITHGWTSKQTWANASTTQRKKQSAQRQ